MTLNSCLYTRSDKQGSLSGSFKGLIIRLVKGTPWRGPRAPCPQAPGPWTTEPCDHGITGPYDRASKSRVGKQTRDLRVHQLWVHKLWVHEHQVHEVQVRERRDHEPQDHRTTGPGATVSEGGQQTQTRDHGNHGTTGPRLTKQGTANESLSRNNIRDPYSESYLGKDVNGLDIGDMKKYES